MPVPRPRPGRGQVPHKGTIGRLRRAERSLQKPHFGELWEDAPFFLSLPWLRCRPWTECGGQGSMRGPQPVCAGDAGTGAQPPRGHRRRRGCRHCLGSGARADAASRVWTPIFSSENRVSQRKCCTSPCGRGAPRASPHHAPPSATSRGGEDAGVSSAVGRAGDPRGHASRERLIPRRSTAGGRGSRFRSESDD